jgi:hypothetical protein
MATREGTILSSEQNQKWVYIFFCTFNLSQGKIKNEEHIRHHSGKNTCLYVYCFK